jgi:hypothetical protein
MRIPVDFFGNVTRVRNRVAFVALAMPTPKRARDAVASALWPASLRPAILQKIEDAQALGIEVPEHTPGLTHSSKRISVRNANRTT